MGSFIAKANIIQPPSGEIKLYLDANCTVPISSITEVDFGEFKLTKELQAGEQVIGSKSIQIWAKNEATSRARLATSCSNPNVRVSMPGFSKLFSIGEVLGWKCEAALQGPTGTGGALYIQFAENWDTVYEP
ncbi:MAG: hypothetical protein PHV11_08080 [Candidatus Bipolaricaulis sp.]|nr:hypothetical protein [Candidatus Bipolaricaulis sp.]